jgi:hypothetical protein
MGMRLSCLGQRQKQKQEYEQKYEVQEGNHGDSYRLLRLFWPNAIL